MDKNLDLLFVYVFELGYNSFHVFIPLSKFVSELREEILTKVPNSLKGVDAHQLTLYKTELPNVIETLKRLAPKR